MSKNYIGYWLHKGYRCGIWWIFHKADVFRVFKKCALSSFLLFSLQDHSRFWWLSFEQAAKIDTFQALRNICIKRNKEEWQVLRTGYIQGLQMYCILDIMLCQIYWVVILLCYLQYSSVAWALWSPSWKTSVWAFSSCLPLQHGCAEAPHSTLCVRTKPSDMHVWQTVGWTCCSGIQVPLLRKSEERKRF